MTRSLRIAKLLVASFYEVDLGSGFTLSCREQPGFEGRVAEWWLDNEESVGEHAGYLLVASPPEMGNFVGQIHVEPEFRGQGLGEKMVRALLDIYGSLSSNPFGNTSDDAIRMWQRMGAEKVPTSKSKSGYFYRLTK